MCLVLVWLAFAVLGRLDQLPRAGACCPCRAFSPCGLRRVAADQASKAEAGGVVQGGPGGSVYYTPGEMEMGMSPNGWVGQPIPLAPPVMMMQDGRSPEAWGGAAYPPPLPQQQQEQPFEMEGVDVRGPSRGGTAPGGGEVGMSEYELQQAALEQRRQALDQQVAALEQAQALDVQQEALEQQLWALGQQQQQQQALLRQQEEEEQLQRGGEKEQQ